MNNIRKNSITGIIENEGLVSVSLHFSEWWNGEGMDFNFDDKNRFSLHMEEIRALMVASIASGMVDIGEVLEQVAELKTESRKREEDIERIRSNYNV